MEIKREAADPPVERIAPETVSMEKLNTRMKVEICKVDPEESPSVDDSTSSLSTTYPDSSSGVPFHIKEELDPVYVCDECGLTVEGEEELKEHVVSTHLSPTAKRFKADVESGDIRGGGDDDSIVCESCGRRFAKEQAFKRHFKAEHFDVIETRVEENLKIPDSTSEALRVKIEQLCEMMAVRRRKFPELFQRTARESRCFQLRRALSDQMKTALNDVGNMIKREFPVGPGRWNANGDQRRIVAYLAFRLQCGTNQLKYFVNGRWSNPLPMSQLNIQAMRERLKQQITSTMPDVIVNHVSKTQRLSERKFVPVKSFKWTFSLRQTFKELVNMHLKNFRFDIDIRRDADEKELKSGVEEHLKRFLKTLVVIWPSGWMSERVLMSECRTIIREFMQTMKEKQRSEFGVKLDEQDAVEAPVESETPADYVVINRQGQSSPIIDNAEGEPTDRHKFVWTKRVVRVRGYGRNARTVLLPKESSDPTAYLGDEKLEDPNLAQTMLLMKRRDEERERMRERRSERKKELLNHRSTFPLE